MRDQNKHQCCCHKKSDEKHDHICCHSGHTQYQRELELSKKEAEFLMYLAQIPFLPVTRFVLKSSKSSHLESTALAPVYLNDKKDSIEEVKNTALILESLAAKRLITIDYDKPLKNGDYTAYSDSSLYAYFVQTVAEGGKKDGFRFDIAEMELGSIALTRFGQISIEALEKIQERDNEDVLLILTQQ